MIKTEQRTTSKSLADALLAGTYSAVAEADSAGKISTDNGNAGPARAVGKGGVPVPAGRPPGVRNKLTNLREAVLGAFDKVGGMEYLARLAEGTQSDRAAFVGLVSKVLPTQINANVEGGIQIQLSWLGGRAIGTTTAQQAEVITQVVDLEQDPAGKYRIRDQAAPAQPAADAAGTPAGQGAGGAKDA